VKRTARHGRAFDRILSVPLAVYLAIICVLVLCIFVTITWDALVEAFRNTEILHAIGLSFFSSAASTCLAVLVAIPSGYVLSRNRFPGMFLFDTILDLPIVLPPLVMGLCILIFFSTSVGGFINDHILEFVYTWRGIILVQFIVGCAFAVRVIKAGFDELDPRYEDVAMTLGANRWQTFLRVTLPNIKPSLLAGAVISWARIFGLFGPVLLVCGTMRNRVEIMPTRIFLEVSIGRIEVALVIGAVMILMSVATLVIFKRLGGKGYLW
jgi:molybdate transport system permease protein